LNNEEIVVCPYCGETVVIDLEPELSGEFVQDCEVCCNPWQIRIVGRGSRRSLVVTRADGSD
jgi:hypothetical protein